MRISKDEYKLSSGEIIALSQDEQPPQGAQIWNGYDYHNQYWVFNGQRDTRTLEELQQALNQLTKDKRQKKIISFYAHDYRDIAMVEIDLAEMLKGFLESLECDHQCTSNCRREGCNCACGKYHF